MASNYDPTDFVDDDFQTRATARTTTASSLQRAPTREQVDSRVGEAQQKLANEGIRARAVSMPSHELFASQDAAYRESVLPAGVKRIAVEAAHPMSWYRWVGDDGVIIGIDRFGASAPYKEIYEHLGLSVAKIVEAAKRLVG